MFPVAGCSRIRVKLRSINFADCRPIVISGSTDVVSLAQKFDALMWVWTVADNVAKAPYVLGPSPAVEVLEHGLECGQVAVDVGEDSTTHVYSG